MPAQPGPSTHQSYTQHQSYAYPFNAPTHTVSTTSQVDPHSVTYLAHQNPNVSPQYQPSDALPQYPYSSASYHGAPTSYSSASVWQNRGTVQQQPAPSSSPPGPSSYPTQGAYPAPSQAPPQSYAGWNSPASRLAPLSYLTGLP